MVNEQESLAPWSPRAESAKELPDSPQAAKSLTSTNTLRAAAIKQEIKEAVQGYEALAYIATWYIMSTILSVYNKEVIGKKYGLLKDPNFEGGFPAPLMMSAVQFLGQYGLALLGTSLGCGTSVSSDPRTWNEYMTTVLPNGVATGLDIGFSNASLGFITLSFYTMCKSSAPLFLLLCAFIWRIEKPTWGLAGIVVVISIGLGMLVDGEVEFNLVGFLLVMSAAAMSGVRWTIAQVLLQGKPGASGHGSGSSALEVMVAVTPVMAVTAALMSIIAEPLYQVWTKSIYFSSLVYTALTLAMIGFGALIAFFMVLVEFMLIGSTSALTFMVAGVFKEFLTIVVSHFLFGDELSWLNVCGLVVLVLGVILFNIWKYNKLQEAKLTELKKNAGDGPDGHTAAAGDDQQLLLSQGDNSSQTPGQEFELIVSAGHSPATHRDSAHHEDPAALLSHPS